MIRESRRRLFPVLVAVLVAASMTACVALLPNDAGARDRTRTNAGTCPWVQPDVVAKSTPLELATMVATAMTPAEAIALLNLGTTPNRQPENILEGDAALCLPSFIFQDGPSGLTLAGAPVLPAAISVAASFDPAEAQTYGQLLGGDATADGVTVVQAPSVNPTIMPTWGRASESFGEDPYLIGQLALRELEGIEGTGTLAIIKHVGVYTQEFDRNHADASVPVRGLAEVYLSPFRAAAPAAPVGAMCALGSVDKQSQCSSPILQRLMTADGFTGFFRSDYAATNGNPAAALGNGDDLFRPDVSGLMTDEFNNGLITIDQLRHAVVKVLTPLFASGAMANPRTYAPIELQNASVADASTSIAAAGTVLLSNNGVLPIHRGTSVAVIGAAAGMGAQFTQPGSGQVPVHGTYVEPIQGITAALGASSVSYDPAQGTGAVKLFQPAMATQPGVVSSPGAATISYDVAQRTVEDLVLRAPNGSTSTTLSVDGTVVDRTIGLHDSGGGINIGAQAVTLAAGHHVLHLTFSPASAAPTLVATNDTSAIALAAKAASSATDAIVVVNAPMGEGEDRASLALPDDENQLIDAVAHANPNTVVVLTTGGAVLMPWLHHVAAVVEAWLPGQTSGTAIAEVLDGQVDPSGHLPLTFPSSDAGAEASDWTTGTSPNLAGPDGQGLDVGYRWYRATGSTPLFPFGFGLSYTTFDLSGLTVTKTSSGYVATVVATNTGGVRGRVVAQGYVTYPTAAGEPPAQLKCIGSATLAPGSHATISMPISTRALQIFAANHWVLQPGTYTLAVGPDAVDLPLTATFSVS